MDKRLPITANQDLGQEVKPHREMPDGPPLCLLLPHPLCMLYFKICPMRRELLGRRCPNGV